MSDVSVFLFRDKSTSLFASRLFVYSCIWLGGKIAGFVQVAHTCVNILIGPRVFSRCEMITIVKNKIRELEVVGVALKLAMSEATNARPGSTVRTCSGDG